MLSMTQYIFYTPIAMTDSKTFNGFSKEAIQFLLDLEKNNNKEWFETHKSFFQDELQQPAKALVAALGKRLQTEISPDIVFDERTNGAGSLMRIYRDTRFSKDKTPYKTNVAMLFWEGPRKKSENPSFGFQFGTAGAGLYAGQWAFAKDMLAKYRNAVVNDATGNALEEAISQVESAGDYVVEGEKYARVPKGYDAQHSRAELLKHKGLHVSCPEVDMRALLSPELVDVLTNHCKSMAPIQQWLVKIEKGQS